MMNKLQYNIHVHAAFRIVCIKINLHKIKFIIIVYYVLFVLSLFWIFAFKFIHNI